MLRGERYFRQIAANVMQRYSELEDGVVSQHAGPGGLTFDPRILNYRLDVEKAFTRLPKPHVQLLLALHRDGLSHAEAVAFAGIASATPLHLVKSVEVQAGRLFDRLGVSDLEAYLA